MAVALSMVLLREMAELPLSRIVDEIRARYPQLNATIDHTKDEESAPSVGSVQLRDGYLALVCMPCPIPWSDLEGPCATSVLWQNAAEEVKAHVAHVVVSVMTELNDIKRSILLTQVTTAVLAACDAAIGVYWGNATLLVPKTMFTTFSDEFLPEGGPPLPVWVDFRVGWQTPKRSAGFTHGMTALGHMEMEARDWPEKPSDLRERLQGLAFYLLEHGRVLKGGDTVGQSASEKIRVVYAASEIGQEGLVMSLRYEAAHRPWWKIW